jgi:hypothetical protein
VPPPQPCPGAGEIVLFAQTLVSGLFGFPGTIPETRGYHDGVSLSLRLAQPHTENQRYRFLVYAYIRRLGPLQLVEDIVSGQLA